MLCEYVLASVERSSNADFDEDVKYLRRENVLTMNTIKNTFQKTASRLEVKKTLDSAKKKSNLLEQSLVTGVESPNKKLKVSHSPNKSAKCTKCEKLGHFAKDCWSDLTCAKCGLKGH